MTTDKNLQKIRVPDEKKKCSIEGQIRERDVQLILQNVFLPLRLPLAAATVGFWTMTEAFRTRCCAGRLSASIVPDSSGLCDKVQKISRLETFTVLY